MQRCAKQGSVLYFQLPLSGSLAREEITGDYDVIIGFQLPLSGSLGKMGTRRLPPPILTFNSLSRDHNKNKGKANISASHTLSTPSLGITFDRLEKSLDDALKAFNSLSRDHKTQRLCSNVLKKLPFNSLSRDHWLERRSPAIMM